MRWLQVNLLHLYYIIGTTIEINNNNKALSVWFAKFLMFFSDLLCTWCGTNSGFQPNSLNSNHEKIKQKY